MRKCDCVMDVGECGCGLVIKERQFVKKDLMDEKIAFTVTMSRKVVLEIDNILAELSLENRSVFSEAIFTDFIKEYRNNQKRNK